MTALFTAADITEMQAESDASLVHSAVLRRGTRTSESGGTQTSITWDANPQWTKGARFSPASAPQENLTAGALQTSSNEVVILPANTAIPADVGDTYYRLEVTHDVGELVSPLLIYRCLAQGRSFHILTKVIGTTEAPK